MNEVFKELYLFVDGKCVKANGYKIGNKGTLISYKNNKIRIRKRSFERDVSHQKDYR